MKIVYSLVICMMIHSQIYSQNCSPATAFEYLDINNVKARIMNGGDMWWDLAHSAEYFVPKSGNVSSFFAGALWIGGIDAQGNLHVAAQTYRQSGNDFFPGPLDASANVTSQTCTDFDQIWKVNKSTIDSFTQGLFAVTPPSISLWPGKGNPNLSFLPSQDLAPFIDVNGDLLYDPAAGDYPAIAGDQALWFVFNDNGNIHSETDGTPLKVEVQEMVYGFKDSTLCTYSTTFYHYKITNKSSEDYDSVFIGLWTDPDLGCYINDFAGCDSTHNLGTIYNGVAVDGGCVYNYGNDPPLAAIQMLRGPEENGVPREMDHYMVYYNDFTNNGNPELPQDYYQYLQAVLKNGLHLKNPLTNSDIDYAFPSDPSDPNGWSMCALGLAPSDFRFLVSSGPFSLKAGEYKTLDFAAIWERDEIYPCPSYQNIIDLAECNQNYFENNVEFTGEKDQPLFDPSVTVFPNPATASVHFSMKNAEWIEIFDITGKCLLREEIKNRNEVMVDKSQTGEGLFFYRIIFRDQTSASGKFIIR